MTRYSRDIQLLIDAVGKEITIKIMAELGGMSLYISKPGAEEIAEALTNGAFDAKAVAAKLNVSQSKVYRVLKELREAKADKRQMSILDILENNNEPIL